MRHVHAHAGGEKKEEEKKKSKPCLMHEVSAPESRRPACGICDKRLAVSSTISRCHRGSGDLGRRQARSQILASHNASGITELSDQRRCSGCMRARTWLRWAVESSSAASQHPSALMMQLQRYISDRAEAPPPATPLRGVAVCWTHQTRVKLRFCKVFTIENTRDKHNHG